MNRTDIINYLIKKNNYQSYLEIGCQNDINFNLIKIQSKIGVDPVSGGTFRGTSDEFFKQNKQTFDIIFVDGLHEFKQVYQDILNSFSILNKDGVIVAHDMNPKSELAQRVPRATKVWNGDCWKALVTLKMKFPLTIYTIDTDHGCGIFKANGKQEDLEIDNLNYENLNKNRKQWLNLISIQEFKTIF